MDEEDLRQELRRSRGMEENKEYRASRTSLPSDDGYINLLDEEALGGNFYLIIKTSEYPAFDLDTCICIDSNGYPMNCTTLTENLLLSKLIGCGIIEEWDDDLGSVIKIPIQWFNMLPDKVWSLNNLCIYIAEPQRPLEAIVDQSWGLVYDCYEGIERTDWPTDLTSILKYEGGHRQNNLHYAQRIAFFIVYECTNIPFKAVLDMRTLLLRDKGTKVSLNIIPYYEGCYIISRTEEIYDLASCRKYISSSLYQPHCNCCTSVTCSLDITDSRGDQIKFMYLPFYHELVARSS